MIVQHQRYRDSIAGVIVGREVECIVTHNLSKVRIFHRDTEPMVSPWVGFIR